MLNEQAKGVYIISATPFSEGGEIDFESVDRLMDFYVERGVSGITILGMMGEAPKLTPEEPEAFLNHAINRVGGRVPVVVGVSGAGLGNMKSLTDKAMQAGASGVMVAPMSGLNTEAKLYNYYAQVFETLGTNVPVVYQDFPLATGVAISADLFTKLVQDFPQLVMLKHEDWPGLNKLSQVRARAENQSARRVSILCGNGGLYLPQELARGADGAMTGFAYPEMLVRVVELWQAGEIDMAEDLFDAYLPLVRHEQQPGFGLAVRKEILRRRGVIECAATRAPGPKLNQTDHEELSRLMARLTVNLQEKEQVWILD